MPRAPCAHCGSTEGQDHLCPGQSLQLIGTVLDGRYQVDGVLGQGGMGMVFRATQTSMGREVAVKTLHPALAAAPQFFERFRREAEMASRLRHPSIITIFDFGRTADNTCYYVMELLEGVSLKALVKQAGPLPIGRAVDIVEQAARALGHAHQMGVIHRDLKPHNMMVQQVDGRDFVKVLDFGLVKALEQDENDQLTSTGQVLGTPQYMPPEQAGGEHVDQRSDLYSLAGVLYFCLTGASPFGANTVRKALQLSLTQQVPPVGRKRQGAPVPEALDAFFQKALAPEKEDRFQSAEAFIDGMHDAIESLTRSELDALPLAADPSAARDGDGSGSAARERGTVAGRRVGSSGTAGSTPSRVGAQKAASNVVVDPALRPKQRTHAAASHAAAESPQPAAAVGKKSGLLVAVPVVLVALGVGAFLVLGGESPAPVAPAVAVAQGRSQSEAQAQSQAAQAAPPAMNGTQPSAVEPARAVEPAAPAPASGIVISFTSEPAGADIYAGDTWMGTTPADLRLDRTRHNLSFRLAGHATAHLARDFSRHTEDRAVVHVPLDAVTEAPREPARAPVRTPQRKQQQQAVEIPVFE